MPGEKGAKKPKNMPIKGSGGTFSMKGQRFQKSHTYSKASKKHGGTRGK